MISDKDLPELQTYRDLEKAMPLEWAPSFGRFVVSGDNEDHPVHRWFRYKESYSAGLIEAVQAVYTGGTHRRLVFLDPYCGVGTGLLSAQLKPTSVAQAIGIERNPLVAFVARTKLGWPSIEVSQLDSMAKLLLSPPYRKDIPLPELSSIATGRCISVHKARVLAAIRDRLLGFRECTARDALLVGLAAAIEPLSKVRKDGRALRFVSRTPARVSTTLAGKWSEIRADTVSMQQGHSEVAPVRVVEGDGRCLDAAGIEKQSIDVVVTSPPYPNNIDYSEVYKLELWLLGFVTSKTQFLNLRKRTFRSHPTSNLADPLSPDFVTAIARTPLSRFFDPILERTRSHEEAWRSKLALGYFSDLWVSLEQQFQALTCGGRSIIVVANSLHGCAGNAYLIPTDLLVARMAQAIGFHLERILVARNTRRRLSGNHFLRESIILLRKPGNV